MPDMRCAVGRQEQPELLAWPSTLRENSIWFVKCAADLLSSKWVLFYAQMNSETVNKKSF